MTQPPIRTETHRATRVVFIDNPPVNALSTGVVEGLGAAVDSANRDPLVASIVVLGAGRTLRGGRRYHDTRATRRGIRTRPSRTFGRCSTTSSQSPKPVVMAIHGTALGGGLELAMAGTLPRRRRRRASSASRKCTLGIIPGAEGTQRLPRLVGVEKALEMCVTAKPITAAEALAHGIIDAGDRRRSARRGASHLPSAVAASGGPTRKPRDATDKLGTPDANAPLFAAARALARKVEPQQPAPLLAIDAIEAATPRCPSAKARTARRELFLECGSHRAGQGAASTSSSPNARRPRFPTCRTT